MANDKKFIAKNGFLTVDAESSFTNSTLATPTVTFTNSGGVGNGNPGTGAILSQWSGDSDAMVITNISQGDYFFGNNQQNNGISFYDGTGGMRFWYNGVNKFEIDSDGIGFGDNIDVLGTTNTRRLKVTDDGSSSPLVVIKGDDGAPWALAIGNDTYSTTEIMGQLFFQADTGENYFESRGNGVYKKWFFRQHNGTTPVYALTIDTASNIGIGTSSPTETFDVNGIIHTRQYFQKEYNGQEILIKAQDSGGDYSIYHTINDSYGNYNIMLGANGNGQFANTGDGVAKVYFTGHGTAGYVSMNAAGTGTAGNNISYSIGLGVDSASNAVYVGNPADQVGLDSTGEGFKIADNTGRIFGTDILGNLSYSSPGQIALSRSNNNPYLSFHNATGARKGYLQHTGNDLYIANETTGEFFFNGGTTVSDPPRLVINAPAQSTTAPGDMYGQIQFRVTGAAGISASGLPGTDATTVAMIAAQDFRNGSGKTNEDGGLGFYTSASGTAMTYRGGISNEGTWFVGTWNNDNNGDSTALLNVNGSIYAANEVYASAATGWTEYGNISSVYYDQDNITINHTGSSAYNALVYGNSTYVNFKASVLFRTSNSDHWGIMFRGQASNPHDNSLQVIVRGSTFDDVRVQQRVAGVQTYLLPTPGSGNGTAVPNPDDGNWHLLEVQVYGNNIIVKIDGTVYISSTSLATQYSSGGTVGLTTYTANGRVDFKSFRVENLSGNTVQGPVEQYADIDINDNDITNIGRLNFINHEGSDYGVTGDVMFDENFYSDTEYGSANNWPGANGGGLAVYNEDGWGRIITDRNMQWLSAHFHGIGISPDSSADPTSRRSALNIGGNNTAVFAGSDALYDKDHNAFINIANYSETSNVEAGIVLRAKSSGAGVHAMYVKHRGTGTTYQGDLRFRSRNTATTSQDNMTIRYDGNVGIGTTDPGNRLHVYESGMVGPDPVVKVNAFYQTDTSYNGHGSIMQLTTNRGDGFSDGYLLDVQNSSGTAMKIRGDRKTIFNPGNTDYQGNQTGVVYKTLQIHDEYDAAGTHWTAYANLDGNWQDGAAGADSQHGWIFGHSDNVRGGLIYDHRGIERMALWSSYGKIDFLIADAADGNGVPIDSNINEAMTIIPGGNIGIGTTAPTAKLDVEGTINGASNIKAYNGTTEIKSDGIYFETGNHCITWNDGAGNFNIRVGHGPAETVLETGYVSHIEWSQSSGWMQVNATSASKAVNDVITWNNVWQYTFSNGQFSSPGDVVAYSSDRRLKTNITNIDNALDKVLKLNGVYFDWADDINERGFFGAKPGEHAVGVIAQEVESVLPELVVPAPFDRDDDGNSKSGENYKTVKYEKLTALLIEAVKELSAKVEDQQAEIDKLKGL